MPQLEQNYIASGKLVYIFYQLPLNSIHPNAQLAAEASECAGRQGKFWEMHDQLFADQQQWTSSADALSIFLTYGSELNLDQEDTYGTCLRERQTQAKVEGDTNFAASVGIGGTPFFVINKAGNLLIQRGSLAVLNGAQPYTAFQQNMDSLLANP